MQTAVEKSSIGAQKVARRPIGRITSVGAPAASAARKTTVLARQKVARSRGALFKKAGSAVRRLASGKRVFYALLFGTLITAAAGAALAFVPSETPVLPWGEREAAIQLPDTDIAEEELLAYSSFEENGQGSGDLALPDKPLLDSVGTERYTVQAGDTLSEIAARHDLDVGTLIGFNGISDVRRVMAGSTLKIPNIDGVPYTVKRGDSLEGIAASFGVSLNKVLDANDLQTALIKPGQQLFIPGAEISEYTYKKAMGTLFVYPSRGRLTSGFGYRIDPFTGIRRMHYGIDLAEKVGTPVRATMRGTVAITGNQPRGYGKYVVLKHDYGYQSLYGHLHSIDVRRGQRIRQGQQLGTIGNSGRSTGPHLHFSIYKNNAPVDPLDQYLH
jgi:murein DD-endopeptidase MepM/ murein hydrolase activator NlpD